MKNMKNKIRVAVLVSGGGTNLQALIDAEKNGELPSAEIALVISNNSTAYALKRAEENGIKALTITKKDTGGQKQMEDAISAALDREEIELVVLAGFMSILSESFVRKYDHRILNVHPSLIPSFCGKGFYGLKVHEAALEKGVKVTGATVHFVNEIPDGGEIILQKAVKVREDDTPETLQKRVMRQAEWKILPAAVEKTARKMLAEEYEHECI
jgi:phosphoribosylglycinamide formyltransferase-1